jgi:hypothetical protein
MRLFGPVGRVRDPGRQWGLSGLVLAAASILFAAGWGQESVSRASEEGSCHESASRYGISAHVFLLGNVGEGGIMTIESALRKSNGRLEKRLRLAGNSSPEQARKNRDYRGEFNILKIYPLRPDGSVDEEAVEEWRDVESSSSGFLKLNRKFQSERMAFFPDHAVATREDGTEIRIEGSYGCILSPLEYLMEHDLKVGQVFEVPFILNGIPRVFRMEVAKITTLSPFKSRAYEISIYAVEKTAGVDRAPKDVWRKKGNVRIWFCKDGPYRNQMLRMKIKFRWYLWLHFDLQKAVTS